MTVKVSFGKRAGTTYGEKPSEPSKEFLIASRIQIKTTGKAISKNCMI